MCDIVVSLVLSAVISSPYTGNRTLYLRRDASRLRFKLILDGTVVFDDFAAEFRILR
jgi:hypothetical protein